MTVLVSAACGSSSMESQVDALPDATRDGAPDAMPAPFVPLHLSADTLMSRAPALTLIADTTIDTTSLTIGGHLSAFFVQQSGYAVLYTDAFTVDAHVIITGSLPLIVVASGHIEIDGNVDLFADHQTSGPGATASGPGVGGPGSTLKVNVEVRESSGGGGGSYGSLGAVGGTGDPGPVPPGGIGGTYGASPSSPLIGGAAGGNGGNTSSGGGAGGGALQFSSAVSITVGSYAINAGGGGGHDGGGLNGGGGGGAGGEILLEAPELVVRGVLAANGGGGGGGGAAGTAQLPGPGQNGLPSSAPAKGGIQGLPQGSTGGNGAAGVSGSFMDATAGQHQGSKGGGGGGGAGRIWLRYRAGNNVDLTGSLISPPAGVDDTLP